MNNSRLLGYFFVILGLFVIVLFTKGQVYEFQTVRAEKEVLEKQKIEAEENLKKLNSIKVKLKNSNSEISSDIEKYTREFKEAELLNFIYSKIELSNRRTNSPVTIDNLTITPAKLNQMQFLESNISLALEVPTESRLKDVLNILFGSDEYKFFITNLNYDVGDSETSSQGRGFNVTIPLKIFYK